MKVRFSIQKRSESYGKRNWKAKSRHFVLLEVLIAMTLIALCAIPLIAPNLWLIREEHHFLEEIKKDRAVNHAYGEILEALYKNTYSWNNLTSGKMIAFNEKWHFRTTILKNKPGTSSDQGYYLLSLQIYIDPTEEHLGTPYNYELFVERKIKGELEILQQVDEDEDED